MPPMMKNSYRYLFLTLTLALLNIPSFSQQESPEIIIGPEFTLDQRSIPIEIISYDSTGCYIKYNQGGNGGGNSFVRFFNPDLTPSDIKIDLIPKKIAEEHTSLGLIKIDNQLLHIILKEEQDSWTYFKQVINLKESSSAPYEVIAKVEDEGRNVLEGIRGFLISSDTSHINFFYAIPNKKKDRQKIRVVELTRQLEEKQTFDYEFPFTNKQISIQKVVLAKNGDLFVFARKYASSISSRNEQEYKKQYSYVTYKLSKGQAVLIDELVTSSKHMRNISIEMDKNKLIIAGLYSEKNIFAAKGYLFKSIDLSGDSPVIKASSLKPFDNDFYLQLIEEPSPVLKRRLKLNRHEESNYSLSELQIVEDTTYIITEKFYYANYLYYSEEVSVICLDEKGEVIWTKKIGRNNAGPYKYVGFNQFLKNSQLFFLYTDSKKNLNHSKGKVYHSFPMKGENECLMLSAINKSGELKRVCLKSREELNDYRFRPSLSRWIDDSTLLLFAQHPETVKNQRFIKLKFNK